MEISRKNTQQMRHRGWIISLSLLWIAIIFSGCHKLPGIEAVQYELNDTVYIYTHSGNGNLHIQNTGTVSFEYSITASTEAISLSTREGLLLANDGIDISVTVSNTHILNDSNLELYVAIDNKIDTVHIMMERKILLNKDIIDLEYSKANNSLVYVTTDRMLNIYHIDTRIFDEIPLFYSPLCVSISPEGTKAAVGHDAHVSYVDLLTKEVILTNDITCEAYDIVLSNQGWAYVTPKNAQWDRIHCLNLLEPNSIEELAAGGSVYGKSKIKLHPSGDYVYVVDDSSVLKFDVRAGLATCLLDASITTGHDFWFSGDGYRLFTAYGKVFKTSASPSIDMTYNGTISLIDASLYDGHSIAWIDHSQTNHALYMVYNTYSHGFDEPPHIPYVYIHNYDNLIYQNKIKLEPYFIGDREVTTHIDAKPVYLFANDNDGEIYVITKAYGPALDSSWALQTIKTN